MKLTKKIICTIIILFLLILNNFSTKPIVSEAAAALKVPADFKGTITFTDEGQTMLTATWNKVSDAEGYKIYYRSNIPGSDTWEEWSLSTTTKKESAQEWIIDGCFQMKVKAYKGSSYSGFTDVITVEGGAGIIDNPIVKLSAAKKTIYTGKSYKLILNNATEAITWKSSNEKVATVTKSGVVKGISKGIATITAASGGKKYTCTITVKKLTAAAAYKNFLTVGKMTVSDKEEDIDNFIYLDIDKNGTKELIILNPSGALVYTYKNSRMVKIGTIYRVYYYPEYVKFGYNASLKTFTCNNTITASGSSNIYQIKDGKLELIHSLSSSGSGLTGSNNYDINRVISDAELISLYKKHFQGKHKICDYYKCNAENISKYIK